MDNTIDVIVQITGTERYSVKANSFEEAVELLLDGDNEKCTLMEQTTEYEEDTFEEV